MGVFDSMKNSAAAVGMSQKVSYATNTMKLNSTIKNNEQEIDRISCQIGRAYVEHHYDDEGGEFEAQLQQIRTLRLDIARCARELEQLKDEQEEARRKAQEEREARRQQKAYEAEQAALAAQRAAAERAAAAQAAAQADPYTYPKTEPQPQNTAEENVKFCASCGGKLDLDAKFCIHCGAPQ